MQQDMQKFPQKGQKISAPCPSAADLDHGFLLYKWTMVRFQALSAAVGPHAPR